MEFDKSKVYTTFNCDEVKIGSKGYFADYKEDLIACVLENNKEDCLTLKRIASNNDYGFGIDDDLWYRYFYLVEESKKRPCTREELIEMLKKQGLPLLKCNLNGFDYMVEKIADGNCYVYDCGNYTYQELCDAFTLLNGTTLWGGGVDL